MTDRRWPDRAAHDELRLQLDFLDFLRRTAIAKVSGLDRDQAVAAPIPTSPRMTALGVVKHLTAVERYWISITCGGSPLPSLWVAEDDESWDLDESDTVAGVLGAYELEWITSADSLAHLSPDATASNGQCTVRWALTHVIQETARHIGHLDFLRELADGTVGE